MLARHWLGAVLCAMFITAPGWSRPALLDGHIPRAAAVDDEKVVVYITKTGKKYHRESCSTLKKSKSPISLAEARKTYGPCKLCSPPQ